MLLDCRLQPPKGFVTLPQPRINSSDVNRIPGISARSLESQRASGNSWDAIYIAGVYARLGESDEAFRWLETAVKQHLPYLIWDLPANPALDELRSDPRYTDLLRRIVPRSE